MRKVIFKIYVNSIDANQYLLNEIIISQVYNKYLKIYSISI